MGRLATGTAIPSPSVRFCTMKPMMSDVPSASFPTANEPPMASPSPRLCRPIPTAISVASRSAPAPVCPSPGVADPPRRDTQSMPASAPTRPRSMRPGPPIAAGNAAWIWTASARASTARKRSIPTVRASRPEITRGDIPRNTGSHPSPSTTGRTPTSTPISANPKMLVPEIPVVATAAATDAVVSIPVEDVTPNAYGSFGTQSKGTITVAERSRSSVAGPSIRNAVTALSTVTDAIVSASGCGFLTRIRISPGRNSTRLTSNVSTAGGLAPTRSMTEFPRPTTSAMAAISTTRGRRPRIQRRSTGMRAGATISLISRRPRRSPSSRAP